MELWVPITIGAAFCQNLRSALQKHLKARLSTTGATFARFAYAAPLAALYAFGLARLAGFEVPRPNPTFLGYALIGGLAQITATALLVHLFSFRNFAVGTAYSKTETVQTAIFGILLLGDPLRLGGVLAILVSLVGVMAIAAARTRVSSQEPPAQLDRQDRPDRHGLGRLLRHLGGLLPGRLARPGRRRAS